MAAENRRVRLVEGGGERRSYHTGGDGDQWVCSRCEATGAPAASSLERYSEWDCPRWVAGKLTGGTKRSGWRCAVCKTKVT